MSKVRVGVILPDVNVPAWVTGMLEQIRNSAHAEIVALALAGEKKIEKGFASRLHHLHFQLDRLAFQPKPDPWERKDIRHIFPNIRLLQGNTNELGASLKLNKPDILLNLCLKDLPESLLDIPRYGIWSLRCNGRRVTPNTDFGWLELLRDEPLIQCAVEAQRGLSAPAQSVAISTTGSDPRSFTHNQKIFLWRIAALVPRALKQLYLCGEQEFFVRAEAIGPATQISAPRVSQTFSLAQKQVIRKLRKKSASSESDDRWILMTGIRSSEDPLHWDGLRRIVPPRGAFWADPFLAKMESKTYLFFEEFVRKTELGRISCTEVRPDGSIGKPRTVLERPYHLSYPFIFEHRGGFYMIPETSQNQTIEVYRCARIPDQWEYHKTIMQGVRAVDATLVEHEGLWWMFVNVAEDGGSTRDELHLFYSDDPLSGDWALHSMNPVISDVRRARPGGRILFRNGGLVRPSQDSSLRYGYALNLNRITKLTKDEYEEELIERFMPPDDSDILAVHTYNFSGDIMVIDAMLK